MKKTLTALLICALMLVLLPAAAMAAGAETGIAVDTAHFPDDHFRSYVAEKCDTDQDGYLSEAEISAVEIIDVSRQEIKDLTGIERFFALTELYCGGNDLTSLDASANTALEYLYCRENDLTSLDVSNCTALMGLDCCFNQLTSLDVSGCTTLDYLYCYRNQLTNLDVSDCTAITQLWCFNNQLTSLETSVQQYYELICVGNRLTHVDADFYDEWSDSRQTAAIELTETDGTYRLDFADLVGKENIDRVAVMSVSPANVQYSVADGILTTESELTSITYIYNNLYGMPLMHVTLLNMACVHAPEDDIAIDEINFPDANFRDYVARYHDSNHDGVLSTEEALDVIDIDVYRTGPYDYSHGFEIRDLTGIEHFPALTTLDCTQNDLTSLDVSKNRALTVLDCCRNYDLASLDVSGCAALQELNCRNTALTSLDVSTNTALTSLFCADNWLTSLDVSNCTALKHLNCYGNCLTCLELSRNAMITDEDEYGAWWSISSQSASTALTETNGTYRLDFADLVGVENTDRVTVTSVTPADAQYSVQDGVLTTETALTKLTYIYDHGGPDVGTMDVTLKFN